jgi:hypothetical protein
MRNDNEFTPEELIVAKRYDAEKKQKLRNALAESADRVRATNRGIDPDAFIATQQLDKEQLNQLRAKLAGVESEKITDLTDEVTEEE